MRKLARAIAARSELSTALSAAKSLRELIEREAHRDFRKRTHRTQADHSTPRAEALDVRVASAANSSMVAYRGFIPDAEMTVADGTGAVFSVISLFDPNPKKGAS
jgi:hypothetical protein